MARTVRDTAMETRSARARLKARGEPYWKSLDAGLALGYRRNQRGGSWLARRWNPESKQYVEKGIGAADDVHDADGIAVLSFSQAQAAARTWWQDEQRRAAGHDTFSRPYTVSDALRDYFAARERRGSRGVRNDRYYAVTRIEPELGRVEVANLATSRLRRWHEDLATKDKLVRTPKGVSNRQTKAVDFSDPEHVRARRASANRVLTIVKAALNHAFHENRAATDEVWRKVKPFRETDAAVVRYLSDDEAKRLLNACEPSFRKLVQAALLTGCRYGELARLRVSAINLDAGTITVRETKSSKRRSIDLKLIKVIQHMRGVEGFDLKTATREVIKFAEEKGFLATGDRRTNSKRIKRLYSELARERVVQALWDRKMGQKKESEFFVPPRLQDSE